MCMLANMLYIVLERWLVPAKCTCKSKNRLFGKGDRTSTAAQAQGTRLQSKLSPLSMCIRPYPSHITQCKPIVTSHSLRALGKRKSLQEKTNILSLFLFVHMFPTKKKKQFLCFPSPRAFTTKYKTCLCVCSACSVIQHTCLRPVFGVPKVSGQMKNEWFKRSDSFVISVGVLMEPPCCAAPSTEASSKARKQSGCYMALVMLSVGNPQARPLIDKSWCNKAASTAYQCTQVKNTFHNVPFYMESKWWHKN